MSVNHGTFTRTSTDKLRNITSQYQGELGGEVAIPMTKGGSSEELPCGKAEHPASLQTITRTIMRVLIVEDNAGVRRLLRSALAELSEEIWECCDGADALATYAAHQPEVVLMDIRMPRMDGLAATKQILLFDPSAKVLIMTDYDDDGLRNAAQEAGACGYALKLNLLDLAQQVRSLAAGGV
jgi:CheY-like chemotaxis protein